MAFITKLRYRYFTKEIGNLDLHLRTLRDNNQLSDDDNVAQDLGISTALWPLFGLLWDSSQVLAHHMFNYELKGKRILEIGCGLALPSLVLKYRGADITASDYHPEVLGFLEVNTKLNELDNINFVRADWGVDSLELGKFDLIIGSDLLYERGHPELLSEFINRHAKDNCEIIIVDPSRGHQSKFTQAMLKKSFTHERILIENDDFLDKPYKGTIHKFCRF